MELDCLSCSVFVYWQQNKTRSCLDTQTPEKNRVCVQIPSLGAFQLPSLKSPAVPPAVSWGLGWGWLCPGITSTMESPWKAAQLKEKPLPQRALCDAGVMFTLETVVSSCSTCGYICKIGLFIRRVKWTGIISFAVVPVEVQAILQEKKVIKQIKILSQYCH